MDRFAWRPALCRKYAFLPPGTLKYMLKDAMVFIPEVLLQLFHAETLEESFSALLLLQMLLFRYP